LCGGRIMQRGPVALAGKRITDDEFFSRMKNQMEK
jgi:hypothetical protein